jgi:hypothetical protein
MSLRRAAAPGTFFGWCGGMHLRNCCSRCNDLSQVIVTNVSTG